MPATICFRRSIQWLPDPPSEPTLTMVVTSLQKRFVDIRTFKPLPGTADPAPYGGSTSLEPDSQPLSSTPDLQLIETLTSGSGIQPTTLLDWAFAGTSDSRFTWGTNFVHCTWTHWVDSRTSDPDSVKDEGDIFPQVDGTARETGTMVNPATGLMTEYEETWVDLLPTPTTEEENIVTNVVMVLDNDEHQRRGMIVRVGQVCQGILRDGDALTLERWIWTAAGRWKRTLKMGDIWLPCGLATEEMKLVLGGEVTFGDYLWKVVELDTFRTGKVDRRGPQTSSLV